MNRSNAAQLASALVGLGARAHLAGCLQVVDKIIAVILFSEELREVVTVSYLTDEHGSHFELVRVSDAEGRAFIVIPVPRLDPSVVGHVVARYPRHMAELQYPEPDPEENPEIVEARLREELLAMVDRDEVEAAVATVLARTEDGQEENDYEDAHGYDESAY